MQPGTVFILTPLYGWRPLVFHAADYWRWQDEKIELPGGWIQERSDALTRCGRARYSSRVERGGPSQNEFRNERSWQATAIRLDRAELIARPCSRCFPGGEIR